MAVKQKTGGEKWQEWKTFRRAFAWQRVRVRRSKEGWTEKASTLDSEGPLDEP